MNQQLTTNLSKFVDLSDKAVEDVLKNPSATNWKKLEQITGMLQQQLVIDGKDLLFKYPTDHNIEMYKKIKHVANYGLKSFDNSK